MNRWELAQPDVAQLEQLRSHLRLKPGDGQAWLALAQLLSQDTPGAELYHAIEQSIKSLPENEEVWLLAATVQERIRGAAAAQQWLAHTAGQNPLLVAPRLALARMQSINDPDGAIDRYKRMIAEFPSDKRAREQLAEVHLEQGDKYRQSAQWQKALDAYRAVEDSRIQDPLLMNNIGCCLAGLANYEPAADYFEKALRLKPDFTEARLNVGLLCASQSKGDEAISIISKALESSNIEPSTRKSAKTILDILFENRRLEPVLRRSVQTGNVDELQSALDGTPARLLQADQRTVDTLSSLAAICREIDSDPEQFRYTAETNHLPVIEAFAQCKIEGEPGPIIEMQRRLDSAAKDSDGYPDNGEVLSACNAIRERKSVSAERLQAAGGEAWLRYWHARLLREAPEKLPGQFKAVTNAIGNRFLTPPENVAGTFRVMLANLRPAVPAGIPRAVFMYVAVTMIHGFADGNGRLSRFIMNWEVETAGLPAVVIPLKLRAQFARSTDTAWFDERLDPLVADLKKAVDETNLLLQEML